MRATPGNYPHKPLPAQREQLQFQKSLSQTQYRALIQGVIPRSQDDKWFAFEDDGWFSMCRSSTGFCIFRVRLEEDDATWRVTEAWANRDSEQYTSDDAEADATVLGRLLDMIIARNST